MLEIRLLGGFDVRLDGRTISIPSRPAQSLFAYLVLNPGSPHRRERLAGLFWPDSTDESARDYLRHALWRIRKSFPSKGGVDCLISNDLTIAFDTAQHYWVDSAVVQQAGENAPLEELLPAVALYRGELLPGFYDEWVALEREHLQAVFEHQMARLMALLQGEGRWQEIIEWGERWISFGQKPEPAFRALMRAHAALGEMSKVAATYERCTKSLQDYGLEPSEQTLALFQDLKAGRDLPKAGSMPSRVSAAETPSNIPVPLTSFIGREEDLKEIASLVGTSRLVTLTGPGGVGKTRLAIQTAHNSIREFKDGVCWVELAALQEESLVVQAVAQALAIREVSKDSLIETIKSNLRSKELLLVLDNCEHLIEACARFAEQLLGACPKLKILATSREGLGLFNELTWHVSSLPVPEPRPDLAPAELKGFAGIELFVERAAHVRPGFVLNGQNAFHIAQICRRLDGIPLALELAAARMKVLLPADIAARLDDRFSVLTSGTRTALARHQTLRATIDWSHDLLSEQERVLFRQLSVFVGGFTLEAAEHVCGQGELRRADVLDLLGRLVDKSLVNVEQVSITGDTRYRFLETIHQYAAEGLDQAGETRRMRDQHLLYFMELAERTGKNIFSQDEALWLSRTESEIENLREALAWSITEIEEEPGMDASWRSRSGLQLAGELVWFWAWFMQNSYGQELTERLKLNLSRGDAKVPTLARARALNAVGFVHYTMNRLDDARAFLDEALEIAREGQDQHTLAWTLSYLGTVLTGMGQVERARSLLTQGLELAQASGRAGKPIVGVTLVYLGDIAYLEMDDLRAHSLYEESIASLRESHNLNLLAYANRRWAYLLLRQGELEMSAPLFEESVTLNHRLGHRIGFAAGLAGCAAHALAQGKLNRAARLMGAVEGRLAQSDAPLFAIDETERERTLQALHSRLDEKTFAKARAKGRAMTAEEAISFALERT